LGSLKKQYSRANAIQGEGDGTAIAVIKQLWVWLFQEINENIFVATANFLVD
jgi:hypothetical protein